MLPVNGRVAIVDDQYEQIKFLTDDLSKHQIAYRVYDGTPENLPEAPQEGLDFRVLFLDLNLIGNKEIDDKLMKSSLYSVLNKLIPLNNYPYVLVYWSRHEEKRDLIENDLFVNSDLSQRKPIAFISAEKSDYFNLDGSHKGPVSKVFETISEKLKSLPAYHLLLEWENLIHQSADKTIQDIFKFDDWSKASSELLSCFLISNMGPKHAENCDDNQTKIRSSLNVLNSLFSDSMGHMFGKNKFIDVDIFNAEPLRLINSNTINTRLLLDTSNLDATLIVPGTIFSYNAQANLGTFFNDVCKVQKINEVVKADHPDWDGLSKGKRSKFISAKREQLREDAKLIAISVDPLCDFVQKKVQYNKFLEGMIFKAENKSFIDNHSEGVFISPPFEYDSRDYVLVLSLKHLNTKEIDTANLPFTSLFRVRQEILAEIQSKLARFISRQGILFLDQ